MRSLTALLLLATTAAHADGLEPLDNETLGASRVEAPILLADEASEAEIHENVRKQQLELPDGDTAVIRPPLALPPTDPALTNAQRQFADNIMQGLQDAATGAP